MKREENIYISHNFNYLHHHEEKEKNLPKSFIWTFICFLICLNIKLFHHPTTGLKNIELPMFTQSYSRYFLLIALWDSFLLCTQQVVENTFYKIPQIFAVLLVFCFAKRVFNLMTKFFYFRSNKKGIKLFIYGHPSIKFFSLSFAHIFSLKLFVVVAPAHCCVNKKYIFPPIHPEKSIFLA